MDVVERFLKYTSYDTQSCETSKTTPSTSGQRRFAEELVGELKDIGLEDVTLDAHGYVMASLPANTTKDVPVIGFIAHLDTSPDVSGKDVRPRIVRFQGDDIVLSEEENLVLSMSRFHSLRDYIGQELIVTDGTTLLGADDKAGIAAIVSAMKYLKQHPHIQHGTVRIAFTPDEEIGRGADHFDVEKFGCQWAYTVDGGKIGSLEYENFNAAVAHITIKGLNIHPGMAKDKMKNAVTMASYFVSSLMPKEYRPELTDGYTGFFHVTELNASVEEASLTCLIREHDKMKFNDFKRDLKSKVAYMNEQFPGSTTIEISDQYYNMREIIETKQHIIDLASEAMREAGVHPHIEPIRGGTDGSRLSFMGLPCPNLFTGGLNPHSRYEYLPVRSLEKSMITITKIIELLHEKDSIY
jgi:tripeptide aminopeptidase